MLNLQPHKQEIYPPDNNILQVVFALGVFELDMQAIFDTDIHLDAGVCFRRNTIRVDPDILFADDISHAPGDSNTNEIAQLDIDAAIRLVLLLDILEVELEGLGML